MNPYTPPNVDPPEPRRDLDRTEVIMWLGLLLLCVVFVLSRA